MDEMMVKFYGRSVVRQYMPQKPTKYGVKPVAARGGAIALPKLFLAPLQGGGPDFSIFGKCPSPLKLTWKAGAATESNSGNSVVPAADIPSLRKCTSGVPLKLLLVVRW